jgi:hypothetical protein
MSISAMKQALEALEEPDQCSVEAMWKAKDILRQAIAEAEKQEPVAWIVDGEIKVRLDMAGKLYYSETNVYAAPVHASDISQERVDETAKRKHEPVKLCRGDILRCIETEELCTVWATSTSGKTLVTWGGNDFTEYTAEQIGELFWLEPESSDVEIAAEQSDNYASFLAGVSFARANLSAPSKREWVGLDGDIPGLGLVTEEFYNGMLCAEDILRRRNT